MKRKSRIVIGLFLGFAAIVILSANGKKIIKEANSSTTADFVTVKVSGLSDLPQGETEIVADNNGHVVVVWMDGSEAYPLRMTLHQAISTDGGSSFSSNEKVIDNVTNGYPKNKSTSFLHHSMDLDQRNGITYLATSRKDHVDPWTEYKDVAFILFRSGNFGESWYRPIEVIDDGNLNTRSWLTVDRWNRVHWVYSPSIPLQNGSGNYVRPVYYQRSIDGGTKLTNRVLVNPPEKRPSGSAGGSARGIGITELGHIVVGIQDVPIDNAGVYGSTQFGGPGYVYISRDNGVSFGDPIYFTTPDTLVPPMDNQNLSFKPHARVKVSGNTTYAVWIGEATDGRHSNYAAVKPGEQSDFNLPVAVQSGPVQSLTLPIITIDKNGTIHVFWIGEISDTYWSLFYSRSTDSGSTFSLPQQATSHAFPIEQWPGDFINAATNDRHVFVAWPMAGGHDKGIYVTIGKDFVTQ